MLHLVVRDRFETRARTPRTCATARGGPDSLKQEFRLSSSHSAAGDGGSPARASSARARYAARRMRMSSASARTWVRRSPPRMSTVRPAARRLVCSSRSSTPSSSEPSDGDDRVDSGRGSGIRECSAAPPAGQPLKRVRWCNHHAGQASGTPRREASTRRPRSTSSGRQSRRRSVCRRRRTLRTMRHPRRLSRRSSRSSTLELPRRLSKILRAISSNPPTSGSRNVYRTDSPSFWGDTMPW